MSKETGGFFRKVVRFVANPTTEWSSLDTQESDVVESEYAKSEIKAMIERKRRNDFVRKREFDMLRKIRREGLSGDAAQALNSPSNLDLDSRPQTNGAPSDIAVKAKIDAIEQQMVGSGNSRSAARPPVQVPTLPLDFGLPDAETASASTQAGSLSSSSAPGMAPGEAAPAAKGSVAQGTASGASAGMLAASGFVPQQDFHVAEMVHDPELDEAVIAFANADFDQCERCLLDLIQNGGTRADHTETWMALFDFYRALDLPHQFDNLALTFAQKFGLSAPQWYSLPDKVARFLAQQKPAAQAKSPDDTADASPGAAESPAASIEPAHGWIAPEEVDGETVSQLRTEILQLPRPWVMDWGKVKNVTAEGAGHLGQLIRQWAKESIELHWIGTENLIDVLSDLAPTGSRSVDPAYWMLHLDVLRMCNNPIQFDEVAIDYCVTYEQSPPSWEPTACKVRLSSDGVSPQTRPLTHVSKVVTSFVESQFNNEVEFVQVAALNLSGQLVGDISDTLTQLDSQLGASVSLEVDCQHLLRVDFIAAGDLLNWVLARRGENRIVIFNNPHRLIALFFGAMGINEHAHVKLQVV
ncbi:MAG: hypothetical protein KBA70_03205 [Aquabacterium sp.]|jgi:hypothetical protein|uniref:hypothetical protein n=1 Tax=Aquabacterium sp. TaxID=1872578 RepID=UPI001B6293F9|nr:hypothetical protein [Aquabacterium sp.]MBP7131749.1 hypothetical protein [Aquabacterium sp.]MBP9063190.1 hypothetical protein [Aquabacterium sp.]MDQ5925109.1 hypothetical protein [Pseudomonadota bacterium]